ncbi:MAG: NADH-quinone oxidoreductase subunit C [Candidatus Omnitrophota bacterium]
MAEEAAIQAELIKKFPFLESKVRVQRARRIYTEVGPEKFAEVFDYAVKNMHFCILCTITGLDEGQVLSFIYHIAREDGTVLNIKRSVPKENPVIKTITPYFFAADIYEREVMDLLGAKVEGLAPGKRYPLPDEWPQDQYPLRKDWKTPSKGTEAKQNA